MIDTRAGVDRERALAITPVSRETLSRLDAFVNLLLEWQARINLIAPSTIPKIWTRHIADSLQLLDLGQTTKTWIDLGSGGGFPGVPIACVLAGKEGAVVHLVESNKKKAAFLRETCRVLEIPAIVHAARIREFADSFEGSAEVVTARAVAPLKRLLDECYQLMGKESLALFPKGLDVVAELMEASIYWKFSSELIPSRTDPTGRILAIRSLERAQESA
jgi:16S rRNA (guanine527-N7)-methyltransferase